uniref:Dynactin subunit 6 n=1 Tax=Odontella aurita TaxID=265563 RepID=A0A7S4JY93_9STRA|mmetsp:Transcript_57142/g.170319  ORF Transcript_57142/g.170319 Transcript_57142/m.170319 type:complete len:237 (+) Transcript_57142:108-818(+)|eukprot:CAMPEP_0113557132 /NCGR_PEP_ID=MMETSP0015_2-20120614/17624_1 /TAXON_ID=2838 /ORGANISM="Odontella" /LENGTH=236 /DNA_ID=CAMNT_0000458529 /DNA_START=112 /DNA_END=822 /DNA_ORIENTATION=- /assembly_acc=CAM_ASM_000160
MSGSVKAVVGRGLREAGAKLRQAGGAEIFTRHRPKVIFNGIKPFETNDTFIAPTASVIGDVTNWDESSVWFGAVVRADSGHPITIGFSSNVQDRAVLNTLPASVENMETGFPPICHVGHYVSVGAGSVLVSCRVEDIVDIGEKCTIMEGAIVEGEVILEAGTVVPPYARIPSGQRWGGNPAKFISNLNSDEKGGIKAKAERIHITASEHQVEFLPVGSTYLHLEDLEKKGTQTVQG